MTNNNKSSNLANMIRGGRGSLGERQRAVLPSIPQRRKHFSWLNGHRPEPKWRPSGHQGKIVRRGSNEVLRETEKLNGFSRNVIREEKYRSQNAMEEQTKTVASVHKNIHLRPLSFYILQIVVDFAEFYQANRSSRRTCFWTMPLCLPYATP